MSVKLICPTVHMNGTSQKSLLEDIENAYLAISAAMDALRNVTPNGRDYYVAAAGAFETAREQHASRFNRLHEVQQELQAIAEGIHDRADSVELTPRS